MEYRIYQIKSYWRNGKRVFTKKAVCQMLNIRHHNTLNQHLEALILKPPLDWDAIREILALQIFLDLRRGVNSRSMYVDLKKKGVLGRVFAEYGVDIDLNFRRLKNAYEKEAA